MDVQASLRVESRVEEIAGVRSWLGAQARASGFSESEAADLGLAVSEACANVIQHAYGGQPGHPIDLRLSIDETKLVLSIRDLGAPFDLDAYTPPDLSEPHEGGYGVFIIRSVVDEVDYDTSGQRGTTLTLVKYRRGRSAERGGKRGNDGGA
jgi:serine/threonine-protein kinase RsbW